MGQKKVNELKVGSIITYINLIISTIIPLLYTPIMLRILGQEEYGLYSLSNSVISYLTLLNLGFGTAIIRFISKFRIEGDHDKIEGVTGLILSIYGIIAIILGIATIAYSEQISSIFRIFIGIWIVYSSIMRFSLALKLKTISSNIWIYSIILAICMFICGLYTIFVSNLVVVSIGISILIYAIIDAIEDIIFLVNVNKLS